VIVLGDGSQATARLRVLESEEDAR
jgi:hypothetical protein